MLDGAPLLFLGMGVVSLLSVALSRRRRLPPKLPPSVGLATLSDEDLVAALATLRSDTQDQEVRRRVTLLIVEEIERRGLPPQHT